MSDKVDDGVLEVLTKMDDNDCLTLGAACDQVAAANCFDPDLFKVEVKKYIESNGFTQYA